MDVKTRKKLSLLMFIGGLLVMLVAFLIDKSDTFSFVQNFAAPAYVRARAGEARLGATGQLSRGDAGFDELDALCRQQWKEAGNSRLYEFRTATKFERTTFLKITEAGPQNVVTAFFVDRPSTECDVDRIKREIEELKSFRLTTLAAVLFGIGMFVQVGSRLLETQTRVARTLNLFKKMFGLRRDPKPRRSQQKSRKVTKPIRRKDNDVDGSLS